MFFNDLGKPPKPRTSIFFSSGSTESSPTSLIQRQVGYLCISPRVADVHILNQVVRRARHTDESDFPLSDMDESHTQGERRNGEREANSRASAPELDAVQMWSAPTSNVRGVDEGDEIAAGPSAPPPHSPYPSKGTDAQASKGRAQVCQSFLDCYYNLDIFAFMIVYAMQKYEVKPHMRARFQ